MSEHYDALETRAPAVREAALMAALPQQVRNAQTNAPGFATILTGVDAQSVTTRAALAALPVTRKSDLKALQRSALPFGGLVAKKPGQVRKIFMSPGPIYEPEGRAKDWWRTARASSKYDLFKRASHLMKTHFPNKLIANRQHQAGCSFVHCFNRISGHVACGSCINSLCGYKQSNCG